MFNRFAERLVECCSHRFDLGFTLDPSQVYQASFSQFNGELRLAGVVRNEMQPAALCQGLYLIKPISWLVWVCFRQEDQARQCSDHKQVYYGEQC
jgi:hypothetical protein